MNPFSSFYKKHFGKQLPLKIRFFNLTTIGGAIAAIPATLTTVFAHVGINGIISSVSTIVLFLIVFIIAKVTKKYDFAIFLTIYGLNFAIFPALYFTTGGNKSGTVIYFIVGIIFTVLMMNGKIMYITLFLEMISYSLIFYFGYEYSDKVAPLTDIASHLDIALDFFLVGIGVAALVKILSSYYESEQKRTNELLMKLEEMSIKDPLTGTYNRRFLLKYLETGMERNLQNSTPVSIIMYDIDKFKLLNDDYGHLVGDEVIRKLSAIFIQNCREYDIVSRYGGEEFIIVLPGAGETTAFKRAEQIRKRIESTKFNEVIERPVTISGGVACFNKDMKTTEEFIAVADQYLYYAKETGRNKTVWSKTKMNQEILTNS